MEETFYVRTVTRLYNEDWQFKAKPNIKNIRRGLNLAAVKLTTV
jgi:hypothetical protein